MNQTHSFIYGILMGHLSILDDRKEMPTPGKVAEYMEQASLECDCELQLAMKERVIKERKEIEEAIRRIEKGTYGICLECGEEIDLRRLLVKPTSKFCYHCQTRWEKKGRELL